MSRVLRARFSVLWAIEGSSVIHFYILHYYSMANQCWRKWSENRTKNVLFPGKIRNNLLKFLGTRLFKQRVVSKVLENRKEILKTKCNLESSVPERITEKCKKCHILETTSSANIACLWRYTSICLFYLEWPVLIQERTPTVNCHLDKIYNCRNSHAH